MPNRSPAWDPWSTSLVLNWAPAGNTDESSKFPSAVNLVWKWTGDRAFLRDLYPASVKAMRYIDRELDADRDGWPEGLGNVERPGMGEEKLDNAVYTIRGYADVADMARVRGDRRVVAPFPSIPEAGRRTLGSVSP